MTAQRSCEEIARQIVEDAEAEYLHNPILKSGKRLVREGIVTALQAERSSTEEALAELRRERARAEKAIEALKHYAYRYRNAHVVDAKSEELALIDEVDGRLARQTLAEMGEGE